MKKNLLFVLMILIIGSLAYWMLNKPPLEKDAPKDAQSLKQKTPKENKNPNTIQNGDIIFHTSTSSQSKAIQLATKSKYSHMGIIYEADGKMWVFEAVQPVKYTLLEDWIKRGENGHYVIKRLRNADELLTTSNLIKMKRYEEQLKGKSYDSHFEWSDDKMYCSELVWKIYKEVLDVEIGELEPLANFDLSHPIVQQKMKERYGDEIPKNEKFISPAAMFNAENLVLVKEK